MIESVFRSIEKELLNRAFIKRFSVDRKRVWTYLSTSVFRSALEQMIQNNRYHSKDVYALLKGFIERYPVEEAPEDWLVYFYQYALSFSFPDAVTVSLKADCNVVAEVFMRVYRVIAALQKQSDDGTWQSKYAIDLLTEEEAAALEDPAEYLTFERAFREDYVYEMMKLNQEVIGYTTLDHICGVHHLAMKVARQLKQSGVPLDLGRVSGAAAGHDVGKFGCKPDEMRRVAYYHYYYTGEWFERRDIVYIRNVAINHSTWDLELDALPIESLILIYADFRVKAERIDGVSHMRFYTLKHSFDVILEKLDNVDTAKELRYKRVYEKLKDFEALLKDIGVVTDPDDPAMWTGENKPKRKYFSLMQGPKITKNVIYASIKHNVEILYRLRDETALNKLLEPVRNSRNMTSLRGYIAILEEYYNYLTQKQKQIVINFLYEKLVLPEEDIRKQCSELIGTIIASYDEEIRKELPPSASKTTEGIDTLGLLDTYIQRFLFPENKIIDRHKKYISYSMRDMLDAFFASLRGASRRSKAIEIVVDYFETYRDDENSRFYLIKSARILPFKEFDDKQRYSILNFVSELLTHEDKKLRLRAYNLIYAILPYADEALIEATAVKRVTSLTTPFTDDPAENYARLRLSELLHCDSAIVERFKDKCIDDLQYTSTIFLSNLKSATLDVAKRFQIELLMRNTLIYDYENSFYMAMHLCNLLKVSALESVRNTAGKMLLNIVPHLSFEQKNDIAVELIRSLEMESFEFTKYIPPYLGKVMLQINPKELDEILENFEEKMSTNNPKLIALIEKTIGHIITGYSDYRHAFVGDKDVHNQRILRMFGILFSGFVHESNYVNQTAFSVIAKDIFSNPDIDLKKKEYLYRMTIKKIMSLMVNTNESNTLIYFNNSASLKYIYSFIAEYRHLYGKIRLNPNHRIAIFPGSFDPFTLGHKEIARDIKNSGYEVLLYVDEFSWSKKTQPNLIRRSIIKKSIASEIDIFQFPRDISINIANEKDLKKLQDLFPESEVYLVVGTDVVLNASAYKGETLGFIRNIPHLIYERGLSAAHHIQLEEKVAKLHPQSKIFTLPKAYENVSSTLLRDYIDEDRDVSSLIDPLVQNYIYDKGLYQREPMFKGLMTTKSLSVELVEEPDEAYLRKVATFIGGDEDAHYQTLVDLYERFRLKFIVVRSLEANRKVFAVSLFHWLRATDIHRTFEDQAIVNTVRNHSVGRILLVHGLFKSPDCDIRNVEQIMLTETLARGLARDYTYCVYKETFKEKVGAKTKDVLKHQGFIDLTSAATHESVYAVNMSSPCTLNLDIHSMVKAPFKNHPDVDEAMLRSRARLQEALTALYPGNLVLNFDRSMIYESLIKKICDENGVPTEPQTPRVLGDAMVAPFGAIFKRWILPNNVTKSIHAEKYFAPDLSTHAVKEYPFYLDIENQIKMLKSFDRPVILVDDLLNKGYRVKALEPYFRKHDVPIQKLVVGIMSGGGQAIAESMDLDVMSAYFLPRIRVWFYESKLYPFIDGDAIWRGAIPESHTIPSVNLILPYASASYIQDVPKEKIYQLSEVALTNAIEIMSALENVYEAEKDRLLTIKRLGEVFYTPRFPDKGEHIFYSDNVRPSEYIKDDLEQLKKLKNYYGG